MDALWLLLMLLEENFLFLIISFFFALFVRKGVKNQSHGILPMKEYPPHTTTPDPPFWAKKNTFWGLFSTEFFLTDSLMTKKQTGKS